MSSVRRWYIFLVCAVSLQSVVWAGISLLRNLLIAAREVPVATIALQVAIIIIGLPLFLVHWLWAQRLATQSLNEREDTLRRFYLYGTLSGLLVPFIANTFHLIWELLWDLMEGISADYSPIDTIIYFLAAMIVLALVWFYHQRVVRADAQAIPESGSAATVRRLYFLGFTAAGLTMTALAIISLLRWLMYQFGTDAIITGSGPVNIYQTVARLIVGISVWLIFWQKAQRLFTAGNEAERDSSLRKFYIYLAIFVATLTAVTNAAFMIAGLFRHFMDLPSKGDIRTPLPVVLGMLGVWAFHSYILRGDIAVVHEAPRQAAIRRLYLYLVAGIGLAAFLVGFSGDISVLIRSMSSHLFGNTLREQLAWFSAALIAGLPVWFLPWREAQTRAVAMTPEGTEERRSVVRKIYLYAFLFIATIAVLGSAVYIVWQLLSLALGGRPASNMPTNLAQAVSYALIGIGVWLYHGSAIRGDGQLAKRERVDRMASIRVAVLDVGEGHFGQAVLEGLRRELPGLALDPIGFSQTAAKAMGVEKKTGEQKKAVTQLLAKAGLIIGPLEMIITGGAEGSITAEIVKTIVCNPACKLLAPLRTEGWEWLGVDRLNSEFLAQQAVHAVKQIAEGAEIKPLRPLTAGAIIGIIWGVLILLALIAIPLLNYFGGF